jgi:pimeloyl-ACP methyl ester carboxylesterase
MPEEDVPEEDVPEEDVPEEDVPEEEDMTERGSAEVAGGRLYYEVDGSGRPLTLLHAGIANLRMWDPQVPAFAERYRVIRYDTRGFGETTTDDVAFSNRQDLADLLDHLGVRSTYLLGCSRGGQIALDFALERPERVDALVTVGSGRGGWQPAEIAPELEAYWSEMERLEEGGEWEPLAEKETALWVDGWGQSTDRVDPELRRLVHGWILDSYQRHGQEKTRPQVLQPPAVGRLAEIGVPTLVSWGALDNSAGVAGGVALADGIPGAQRFVFPGAAHLPNLEQPEAFTRLVLDFLAEVDAARATAAGGLAR